MAKVKAKLKLNIVAQKATPAPPVGSALGQYGVQIMDFCNKFNKIKTREECLKELGFIHNQHQRIHAFIDGNSRTTRLLVNWLLIKFKFPLLVLKIGAFEKYMSLTKLSTRRDDDSLRDFLLHLMVHEELVKS